MMERERLSIDVLPDEHRQIKEYAARDGKTIRDYILESIRERLHQEAEEKEELSSLSNRSVTSGKIINSVCGDLI